MVSYRKRTPVYGRSPDLNSSTSVQYSFFLDFGTGNDNPSTSDRNLPMP